VIRATTHPIGPTSRTVHLTLAAARDQPLTHGHILTVLAARRWPAQRDSVTEAKTCLGHARLHAKTANTLTLGLSELNVVVLAVTTSRRSRCWFRSPRRDILTSGTNVRAEPNVLCPRSWQDSSAGRSLHAVRTPSKRADKLDRACCKATTTRVSSRPCTKSKQRPNSPMPRRRRGQPRRPKCSERQRLLLLRPSRGDDDQDRSITRSGWARSAAATTRRRKT
jgi:hypothetical protein